MVRRPEEDEPRVALAGDSLAGSATAGISKEEQKFELKSKAALQSRVSRSVSYESLAWRRSECFCAWAALLRTSGQVVESRSQVMNDERSALGEISCPKCFWNMRLTAAVHALDSRGRSRQSLGENR